MSPRIQFSLDKMSLASDASSTKILENVIEHGIAIVPQVLASAEVDAIVSELSKALVVGRPGVLDQSGRIYAARSILQLWPPVADVWRRSPLPEILRQILGPKFGVVRVLFFDKPPDQTWSLPWHKDLTIAVKNNRIPSEDFTHPTTKSGVPHVEAGQPVLEEMLTARIHLDDVTEENGPMQVIPGSHLMGKAGSLDESKSQTLLAKKGDVLLIRPLVEHNSLPSRPRTELHRRILHLEFACSPELPDGYEWHDFVPGLPNSY
jgi:hypothetical protein